MAHAKRSAKRICYFSFSRSFSATRSAIRSISDSSSAGAALLRCHSVAARDHAGVPKAPTFTPLSPTPHEEISSAKISAPRVARLMPRIVEAEPFFQVKQFPAMLLGENSTRPTCFARMRIRQ